MLDHEAEVIVRPMSDEEIKKYGQPLKQKCASCGRELLLSEFALMIKGEQREKMVLGESCRKRHAICKDCEKKQHKRQQKSSRQRTTRLTKAMRPVTRSDGKKYATARLAAENNGITLDYLLSCLRGQCKRAGGYGWQWTEAK